MEIIFLSGKDILKFWLYIEKAGEMISSITEALFLKMTFISFLINCLKHVQIFMNSQSCMQLGYQSHKSNKKHTLFFNLRWFHIGEMLTSSSRFFFVDLGKDSFFA